MSPIEPKDGKKGAMDMRVATFGELRGMPAGTIYCEVEDGYAVGLYRKGGDVPGPPPAFLKAELLPQALSDDGGGTRELRIRAREESVRPFEADAIFFVLGDADRLELISACSPHGHARRMGPDARRVGPEGNPTEPAAGH